MKFLTIFFIFIALLALFSFTVIGSSTYVPYSRDLLFTHMYPYEGFRSFKDAPTGYSTYPENQSVDVLTAKEITPTDNQCRKLMGFGGLFCPVTKDEATSNPTDTFSKAEGKTDCESYGLMNSRGYLCLDAKQKQLLTSRGGNATGGNMQIGQV
jgi:hypothetical protein